MIELMGIEKTYRIGNAGRLRVIKEINLNIEHWRVRNYRMGPSGSGKSTLMNIVGCLDRATRGKFKLLGKGASEDLG